jgi:hypothetical protein
VPEDVAHTLIPDGLKHDDAAAEGGDVVANTNATSTTLTLEPDA